MEEINGCSSLLVALILSLTCVDSNEPQKQEGECQNSDFFGNGCVYLCRCSGHSSCHRTTGECPPNSSCTPGWFGPGCQYDNILTRLSAPNNPSFLIDNNKTSCNPESNSKQLVINLTSTLRLNWFRLHTNRDISNYGLDFVIDKEKCVNKQVYRVADKILDVNCDSTGYIQKLILQGPYVVYVCDIEISGGRNLAIKQKTNQSSNLDNIPLRYITPDNAVDGSRSNTLNAASCSHTDKQRGTPWWTLMLPFLSNLNRIHIYNIYDYEQKYLLNFKVEVFPALDQPARLVYRHYGSSVYALYIKLNYTQQLVILLKISSIENPVVLRNVLALCEVETFGDFICPDGKHGLSCEKTCECGPSETCSPVTGACGASCVQDQTDGNCSYRCHHNCLSTRCQADFCISCVTSECRSCRTGFFGTYCDTECPNGTFGEGCKNECSSNCSDSLCNSTTGDCFSCSGGRMMPLCLERGEDNEAFTEDGFDWRWLLLLLLLMPLGLCLFGCFMWRKNEEAKGASKTSIALNKTMSTDDSSKQSNKLDERRDSVNSEAANSDDGSDSDV